MINVTGTDRVKRGMAEMQKGGVIMDVVNAEQAKIAEEAGAVAVMALERVPADIRAAGGVSRMADPQLLKKLWVLFQFRLWQKPYRSHCRSTCIRINRGRLYR